MLLGDYLQRPNGDAAAAKTEEDVMKSAIEVITTAFCALMLGSGSVQAADRTQAMVAYPDGYRQWSHVKTMVIQQGHPLYQSFGGIHHIYANAKAVSAMKKGSAYPDGSVLVFDLLDAKAEGSAITEGHRKIVGVMQKNARKFAATGGWGFEGFRGDTRQRTVADARNTCFACHESEKKNDYVFGAWRK